MGIRNTKLCTLRGGRLTKLGQRPDSQTHVLYLYWDLPGKIMSWFLLQDDVTRGLLDSVYVVLWKPSRDFTRPLGPPSGLKGLLHKLNAIVIPMKLCRLLMVLVMVDVAPGSRIGAWLRALICTDIAKITRKRPKPDKHEHGNG
ncbi:hypothetical protein Tco_0285980 [Tanacetum coccineum]